MAGLSECEVIPPATRCHAHVTGLVQGVGFRPFVWRLATSLGLAGWVANDGTGVVLEVEGAPDGVAALLAALHLPPPLARVDQVSSTEVPTLCEQGFTVRGSEQGGRRRARVAPDAATCTDCLRELGDPADRRYGYPFLSCTSCGPRYTIVQSVPYDRSRTTMAAFAMCPACLAEYEDPADRRFHAEPACCPACGPRLLLDGRAGGDPLADGVALLRAGGVLAVKGLGGYHLAVDARQEAAVAALRSRKHREDRPFALMVADLAGAAELCLLGPLEEQLLTSAARPIVLLQRREGSAGVAVSVAPGSPRLGVVLAYTPLHALLLGAFGGPLVMTSGNASDEPIAFEDADARRRLTGIADAVLSHDRAIRTRVDDSVVKVVRDRVVPLRRSRGYVPDPVALPVTCAEPVLACGPSLKATFALARDGDCFVSHHVGDLGDWATQQSYLDGIAHLSDLLDLQPRVVAHDLHPDYPSTRYAQGLEGVTLVGVQHHHAHIASCLADNGVDERVIGVAFDGLGLGTDRTAWGGEVLLADLEGFTRAAHLQAVPLPGGDAAARQPWRMAASHLDAAYGADLPGGLDVVRRQGERWQQVVSLARSGSNAPLTTSAGRLFDAVSALLGVRDAVTYEGQAAIELEDVADPLERGSYPVPLEGGVLRTDALVRSLVEDLRRGTGVPVLAARFHNALADAVVTVCERLRDEHGLGTVALSGGVFQNGLLLTRCLDGLEGSGFRVLTHRQVPPNDGGISLGQVAVAAARLRVGL
jgi:hydrogenase maturation protein HypF